MLDVNELKLKNIRFYKGRYVVRLMRSYKTLEDAIKVRDYLTEKLEERKSVA